METHKIEKLNRESREARKFFAWLKNNQNCFRVLGASFAEEETGLDYYEIISLFKQLDEIGAGNFIVGRKGHDSRMSWHFNTIDIGKAADSGVGFFSEIGEVPEAAISISEPPKDNKGNSSIKHSFNLRKDFEVELVLPEDLDQHDIDRLKSWLDLLSY